MASFLKAKLAKASNVNNNSTCDLCDTSALDSDQDNSNNLLHGEPESGEEDGGGGVLSHNNLHNNPQVDPHDKAYNVNDADNTVSASADSLPVSGSLSENKNIEVSVTIDKGIKITVSQTPYKYEGVIYDFIAIQTPKAFIEIDECRNILLEELSKFEIEELDSKILMTYCVFRKNYIKIELPLVKIIGELDPATVIKILTDRVAKLEALIYKPVPVLDDTQSHIHVYPRWDTFEEFKQLLNYKNFEMFDDHIDAAYLSKKLGLQEKKDPGRRGHNGFGDYTEYFIKNADGIEFEMTNICHTSNSSVKYAHGGGYIINANIKNKLEPEDRALEYAYIKADDEAKALNTRDEIEKDKIRLSNKAYFAKSVKYPKYKHTNLVYQQVIQYIKRYCISWYVSNFKEIFDKDPQFEYSISKERTTITVKWDNDAQKKRDLAYIECYANTSDPPPPAYKILLPNCFSY